MLSKDHFKYIITVNHELMYEFVFFYALVFIWTCLSV